MASVEPRSRKSDRVKTRSGSARFSLCKMLSLKLMARTMHQRRYKCNVIFITRFPREIPWSTPLRSHPRKKGPPDYARKQNSEAARQPSTNPGRVADFGKVESSKPAQRFNLRGTFFGKGRQSVHSSERSEVAGQQGQNGAKKGEVFEGGSAVSPCPQKAPPKCIATPV